MGRERERERKRRVGKSHEPSVCVLVTPSRRPLPCRPQLWPTRRIRSESDGIVDDEKKPWTLRERAAGLSVCAPTFSPILVIDAVSASPFFHANVAP